MNECKTYKDRIADNKCNPLIDPNIKKIEELFAMIASLKNTSEIQAREIKKKDRKILARDKILNTVKVKPALLFKDQAENTILITRCPHTSNINIIVGANKIVLNTNQLKMVTYTLLDFIGP